MSRTQWTPRHSKADLNAIALAAQSGDERAVLRLLEMMRPYVVALLRRVDQTAYSREQRRELDQAAWLGVLVALQRFDPERETKFSTYAWPYIQHEIGEWLARNSGALPLPKIAWQLAKRLEAAWEEIDSRHPADATPAELANVTITVSRRGEDTEVQVPYAWSIFRARRSGLPLPPDTWAEQVSSSAEDEVLEEMDRVEDQMVVAFVQSLGEVAVEEWESIVADWAEARHWPKDQTQRLLDAAALYHGEVLP